MTRTSGSYRLALFAMFPALVVIMGCPKPETSTGLQLTTSRQNGFSEASIPDSRAQPHHVVVAQLEHPNAPASEGDSGDVPGEDAIPYRLDHEQTLTFCMEDDDGQEHTTTLRDAAGTDLFTVTAGGECVTRTLAAGDYTKILRHDGSGGVGDQNAIFINPQFKAVEEATLSGIADGSFAALNPAGKGQTVPPACTLIDTWSLQISNGNYLTVEGAGDYSNLSWLTGQDINRNDIKTIGTWEIFKVYYCGTNKIAMQDASGRFITRQTQGCNFVAAQDFNHNTVTSIGPNEMFAVNYQGGGQITLTASNGYLAKVDYSGNPYIFGTLDQCYTPNTTVDATALLTPNHLKDVLIATRKCPQCNLNGAALASYNLAAVDLTGAHLQNAILSFSYMADAVLAGADLSGAHLDNVDFYRVSGAPTVAGGNLVGAQFSSANLIGVNFDNTHIEGANFSDARILGGSFQNVTHAFGTPVGNASFVNALLAGADFANSVLDGVDFANAIFSTRTDSVTLTVRNSLSTSVSQPYDFIPTIRPLSTTDNTTCPDTGLGPCATDPRWVAKSPPVYEGYNDPNQW